MLRNLTSYEVGKQYTHPVGKATTDSWRVDETYVKIKGEWMYLYRAVDSAGNTLDFFLSAARDAQVAKRFFSKALGASHTVTPRVINVDKNAAYPKAFKELKEEGAIPNNCELTSASSTSTIWSNKTIVRIKRRVKPGLGFFSFHRKGIVIVITTIVKTLLPDPYVRPLISEVVTQAHLDSVELRILDTQIGVGDV